MLKNRVKLFSKVTLSLLLISEISMFAKENLMLEKENLILKNSVMKETKNSIDILKENDLLSSSKIESKSELTRAHKRIASGDDILFTFSATNSTDTTITVTGSGSSTTNANGSEWSNATGEGNNVLDDQSSSATLFDSFSSSVSGNYILTGNLKLSASGQPDIAFSNIFFDNDNNGDDIGFSPSSNTAVSASTLYTLSGSATFTLTSGDFSGFNSGTYIATNFDSISGGFLNFDASSISVAVSALTSTLAYDSTTFTEASANDGSITTTLTVTLANDTFTTSSGAMTLDTHYSLANVPTGLSAVVTGTSATTATITLTGNASAHENTNDISNLTVTFLADAFTTTTNASTVTNYSKSDLSIDFTDAPITPTLTYDSTTFTEASANNGSTTTTLTVTLVNDTFTTSSGAMTLDTHYSLANVPTGLSAVVTGTSTTTATITLTGNASAHENINDISNLTVTFLADAFTTTTDTSTVTNYIKSDLNIDFTDAPTVDLSSVVTASKWNMIAVPNEREVTATNLTGATIWTYNNSTPAWEQPSTLIAEKGYWLYTTDTTGYNTISASVASNGRSLRSVNEDYTAIKGISADSWTLIGVSHTTAGISWSDIYSQANTLKSGCGYTHIFHYDSANDTWNTTSNVPYLGAIWVKHKYCY